MNFLCRNLSLNVKKGKEDIKAYKIEAVFFEFPLIEHLK